LDDADGRLTMLDYGSTREFAPAFVRKLSELTATMLSCYRKRDWSGALEALHLCRHTQNNFGLDEIYNLYLARIQSFQEKGPPDDWDGVFAVETK
jgi:adenylate cyclase